MIFRRESHGGRGDGGVDGDENHPDDHGTGDGEDGILGPDVGDERRLAQHRGQDGRVERRAPDPMARDLAVALGEVILPDVDRSEVEDQGMIEAVQDPGEEGMHLEEDSLLAQSIELRIAIEEAGVDELIEDAHGKGREDGEEDVVKGEGPRFVDDFAGKGVLKRILSSRHES